MKSVFRKQVKNLLETLTGCEIERFGGKSFALIDKQKRSEAWFSYHAQIRSLIEKLDIDLVIDIGANEGQFARELRSFYHGDIISFEPVSSTYLKLSSAASSDPNWDVRKLAIGSQDLNKTIYISNLSVFSSLLKINSYGVEHFGSDASISNEEVVSVRRLDLLLDKIIPNIDERHILLKMDTQGYDLEVFKGLGDILKHIVAIQSELSLIPIYENMPSWIECISTYERAGFGIVAMFPVNQDSGRIVECDCLLKRV